MTEHDRREAEKDRHIKMHLLGFPSRGARVETGRTDPDEARVKSLDIRRAVKRTRDELLKQREEINDAIARADAFLEATEGLERTVHANPVPDR